MRVVVEYRAGIKKKGYRKQEKEGGMIKKTERGNTQMGVL